MFPRCTIKFAGGTFVGGSADNRLLIDKIKTMYVLFEYNNELLVKPYSRFKELEQSGADYITESDDYDYLQDIACRGLLVSL